MCERAIFGLHTKNTFFDVTVKTGIGGDCELDDYAEEIYRRSEEWEERNEICDVKHSPEVV
nr:MAG TPA: hypothetical protein [Caudoviricetes sp.]